MDESVGAQWVQRGIVMHERDGRVPPMMWAEGHEFLGSVAPASAEAFAIAPNLKTLLLSMLCSAVDAHSCGTLNEAWVKTFAAEDMPDVKAGDLAMMAAVDPTVRTCITATWLDVASRNMWTHIAVKHVDDYGEEAWALDWQGSPSGPMADVVSNAKNGLLSGDDAVLGLDKTADVLGWGLVLWRRDE